MDLLTPKIGSPGIKLGYMVPRWCPKIFKNLRCIVCQGQSIAESNSDFAQTIKIVVRDKIDQGDNEKEIYEFLAEKYGEWIIYKPKFNYINSLLWFSPYIVLVFGGLLIFKYLRRGKH